MGTLMVFQGGGPTAVINSTLASMLAAARPRYGQVLGLQHSLEGGRDHQLVDLTPLTKKDAGADRARLAATPGAILGSSRKKVERNDLARVFEIIAANRIDALAGIGGNGTMAALQLVSRYASGRGYSLQVIGVPKTVDNDLPNVAYAPGFGSAARFVALATRDFGRDFRAMSTFDDVTILETMGRNAGWLVGASRILSDDGGYPDMVLLPEMPVDEAAFLDAVSALHAGKGHVFVCVNEMLQDKDGGILGAAFQNGPVDSLGRSMYSLSLGTGNYLADRIWSTLGLQSRCLRPGSLGRALSCCVSEPDRQLAEACGWHAIACLAAGETDKMISVDENLVLGLTDLANAIEARPVPERFLAAGFDGVNDVFVDYCRPIIGSVEPLF